MSPRRPRLRLRVSEEHPESCILSLNLNLDLRVRQVPKNARYEEQRLTVFGGYGTVALWCMGRAAEMI
jgi:hypothetical protein